MKALTNHVLRDHVALGGLVSIGLIPLLGARGALLFWLASIFIDIDHYLHFLFYTRLGRWRPSGMFAFCAHLFSHIQRDDFLGLEIFHTAEFLLLVAAVSFYFYLPLQPAFWGVLFHLLVDVGHLLRHRALSKRVHSFVEFWLRRRRLLRAGLSPDWIYNRKHAPHFLRFER